MPHTWCEYGKNIVFIPYSENKNVHAVNLFNFM